MVKNISPSRTDSERQNLVKQFSIAKINRAFPLAPKEQIESLYEGFIDTFLMFDINDPIRISAFLAQCAHESANFTKTVENLNYSLSALRRVFPKYFPTDAIASKYQRKPQKIASRVYANRMGNGSELSGDGWLYRGRGLIQLTGKTNYIQCGKDLNLDLLNNPDSVAQTPLSTITAGWFWDKNKLNLIADKEDIVTLTKRINGGTHGLDDRISKYNRAKTALT
jgi:putative chitinase